MRVIACINQNGGVGKTTICANLAYAISERSDDSACLCIDLDPQGHLSQYFGLRNPRQAGIDQVFLQRQSLAAVTKSLGDGLSIVSAGPDLQRLEVAAMARGKGMLLSRIIKAEVTQPLVLLDCPPATSFLTVNALAAANELLIPVTPDYFGLSGVSQLMATIQRFEQKRGPYRRKRLVVSRAQRRRLTAEVTEKLDYYFGNDLAPVQISERATVAESPSHGCPVITYAPSSHSSDEFRQLAQWVWSEDEQNDNQ